MRETYLSLQAAVTKYYWLGGLTSQSWRLRSVRSGTVGFSFWLAGHLLTGGGGVGGGVSTFIMKKLILSDWDPFL